MSARELYLDIETSPIVAHAWSLRDLRLGINQIIEDPRIIGFSALWSGDSRVQWWSEYHHGRPEMLRKAHELLDEADIVTHYNGQSFDVPWIQGELWRELHLPPSPVRQVDLYKAARKAFRLPSYKLQYVSKAAGLEGKVSTGGHELWVGCLQTEDELWQRRSWNRMRTYCKQDTALLPRLKERLLPWISNHPNLNLFEEVQYDEDGKAIPVRACPNCQSTHLQKRGWSIKQTRRYRRYQCQGCGTWTTDTRCDPDMKLELMGEAR